MLPRWPLGCPEADGDSLWFWAEAVARCASSRNCSSRRAASSRRCWLSVMALTSRLQVLAVAQHRVQEALAEGIQLLEELGRQQGGAAELGILGEQFADIGPAEGLEFVDGEEDLAALLQRHGLLQTEAAPQQVDQGAAQNIHRRVVHIAAGERA